VAWSPFLAIQIDNTSTQLIVLEKQLKTARSEGDTAAAESLEAATKQLLHGCFIYKK